MLATSDLRPRALLIEALEERQMLSIGGDLFDELTPALQDHTAQYYDAFYVYKDRDSGANHFVPTWFTNQPVSTPTMDIDTASIRMPGDTCIEVSWNGMAGGDGFRWNGVGFVEPAGYEGTPSGNPYSLFDSSPAPEGARLLFDAKIDPNDEGDRVEFGFAENGDSTPSYREWFNLSQDWATYSIDLSDRDLSELHLGFIASVNNVYDAAGDGVVFDLDNIRYEWPRPDAPRLIQSFIVEPDEGTYSWEDAADPRQAFEALTAVQGFDVTHANTAYVYDQVVGLMALGLDGSAGGLTLSQTVGEGLREAWTHDWSASPNTGPPLNNPPDDQNQTGNRLYDAYSSGDPLDNQQGFARPTGWWVGPEVDSEHPYWIHNYGFDTGNHAWAMLGFLRLWEQTGDDAYLGAATDLAQWVVDNLKDPDGGFSIGWDFLPDGGWTDKIEAKSTEHNTDLYAAFSRLSNAYAQQGNAGEANQWHEEALHAGDFVIDEMFDAAEGRFYIGTSINDGTGLEEPNPDIYALDAQTWTYLVFADSADYADSIDWSRPIQWAENTLKVAEDGLVGFDFGYQTVGEGAEAGPDGIWWEGTAQMALVYVSRGQMEDYGELIASLKSAYDDAATVLLPASNREGGLSTGLSSPGGDWLIFERGHVGATAWALFAAAGYDPFWDRFPMQVTVTATPTSVTEDGTAALEYTFSRTGATTSALTVSFGVSGTATYNDDYSQSGAASFGASSGTVTIPAGSSGAVVIVDPTADSTAEGDETVVLTVDAGSGYTIGNPNAATGTIADDDVQGLVVTPLDVSVPEGSLIPFTVKLAAQPTADVVVTVTKQGGDGDLSATPASLTFTPTNWSQTQAVTVAAVQDADALNGTAGFVLASDGLTSQTVTAREWDDELLTVTPLPVDGDDNTTGIAVLPASGVYGVTDAYEEEFEIHSLDAPYATVRSFSLDELCDLAQIPRMAHSTGPDGLTSVTAYDGSFYVIAVSDSSADAIFKVSADGTTVELFAQLEIYDRADHFNYSEITPGLSPDQFFLAKTDGLLELDASGSVVRTIDTGDFNGVALVGNSLFAGTNAGRLRGDLDLTDDTTDSDETPWTTLVELNQPIADLQYGAFGSIGPALFVMTQYGDVGYWTLDSLAGGDPGQPTWFFHASPAFKIDFAGGDMFVSLGENAARVSQTAQAFEMEAVESAVSVTEGHEATAAIRLHGTAPPVTPVTVTVAWMAGDPDIIVDTTTVTFDANNWRADAYVKLHALPDADADGGTATIVASAPGLAPVAIQATEYDKDGPLGIHLRQPAIEVREGRTGIFQVNLTADPITPVTVTTTWTSGDTNVQVQDHGEVQFDSSNWDQPQWVALAAGTDADVVNGTAIFTVSATGMTSQQVTVTVKDTGLPVTAVQYDALVDDYQPLPLQGETQSFEFYDRLGGDRGETYSEDQGVQTGRVEFGRGYVEARVTGASGFAGVWHSLNHSVTEGIPLDLGALLPAPIQPDYQYQATGIWVEIEDGSGQFKFELRDPANGLLWSHVETLSGGSQRLFVPLSDPPSDAQLLTWIVQGDAGSFVKVNRIGLEVQGPQIGNLEAFLWPYAWLLGSFDADTGLTRDRAEFPTGDFDAVNASGAQAALAAVAEQLGIISTADAVQIVTATRDALLDLQSGDSVNGVLPHFVKSNFVLDNPLIDSGVWVSDTSLPGYYGPDCLRSDPATGAGQVRWDLTVSRPGEYEVFARWTAAADHASDAPYTVNYEGGQATVAVDQQSNGGTWVSLGKYTFAKGTYSVTLSNQATGTVIADALRLEGPPQIVPNTEYSTIDTLIGLGGVLLASQSLGLPTADIEQAISNMDWSATTLPDGTISHGYTETGDLLPNGWDTFGGESLLVALFCAASTGEVPAIPNVDPLNPQTYNGSGFIDELPWLFVDAIQTDAWGVNWDAYRQAAAEAQVAYFDGYSVPAFGLSAVEPPTPSQFPVASGQTVAIPYAAYGVGGLIPANDGSDMFNQPVAAPHYSGMIASLESDASSRMWDWMQDAGLVSPLNAVESLVVQQWGTNLETHYHGLKGNWNTALQAMGWGRALLGDNYPLASASRANEFVAAGLNEITLSAIYQPGLDSHLGFNLVSWWDFGANGASTWTDAVQDLYDSGHRAVSIIPVRYVDLTSGDISITNQSPAVADIADAIARAHSLGMVVTVNPFVEPQGFSTWRGNVGQGFTSTAASNFFTQYSSYLSEIATAAESNGADRMTVGSELVTLTANADYNDEWSSVIDTVTGIFHGSLGYAANWNKDNDEFENPNVTATIWENPHISFVGVDLYEPLATVAEADASGAYPDWPFIGTVEANWTAALDSLHTFAAARKGGAGMPVVLTEVGLIPYNLTTTEPNQTREGLGYPDEDPAEQTNGFEALLGATDGASAWLPEMYVWHWGMPGAVGSDWYIHPGDPLSDQAAQLLNAYAASAALYVTSLTSTTSGFVAHFNRALDASELNLYDQGGALGVADVDLTGSTVGNVQGSIVLNAAGDGFTFVKTGGVLEPDTYTVTLRSADDGFKDATGELLDGNGDGTSGDDYSQVFTVAAPAADAVAVGLPDFARGYGQAVHVPATGTGLPLVISSGQNVGRVDLTVQYDPTLLNIAGFTPAAGLTPSLDISTPGVAILSVTSAGQFSSSPGEFTVGSFSASVPDDAPYASKEVLDITDLHVYDSSAGPVEIASLDDDAVHVAAYFGDTNGSQTYSSADAVLLLRMASHTRTPARPAAAFLLGKKDSEPT